MTNSILRIKEQRNVLEQLTALFLNLLMIYPEGVDDGLEDLIISWDFFNPYEVMWILKVARFGEDELKQYLEHHVNVQIRTSRLLRDAICFYLYVDGGNERLIRSWKEFDHCQVA